MVAVTRCSAVLLLAALHFTPASAQLGKYSLRDLTVVSEFSWVTAVATSSDRVYVASETSVAVWNPLDRHWIGPWLAPVPGLLRDVVAGVADQLGGGVWLIRSAGWVFFEPEGGIWESGTVPGRVMSAALDEAQPGIGLFLRTTAGWYLAQRGGTAIPTGAPARPIPPATVGQATRENPAINATSASLINLTRLRTVQFTAAARATAFTGMGWYIGTRGAGLLYYPNGAGLPEAMPLGLPRGVPSALFAGPRGVWAATARSTDADAAIAFVATDLSEFRWWQGPLATGFPFAAARRMVGLGQTLWLATDAGAVKVNPREDEVRRYDIGSGLPDSRITDIAQRRGVIAIATPRGAARWHDSTGFERVAPEFAGAVDAVALEGDTTWLGTRLGLYYGVPDDPRLRQTPGFGASASFQVPVVDIAWLADTLVALTPDRLMWRLPGTDSVQLGPGLAGLGTLHTVIPAWAGVFVAGDRGVAYTSLAGTPARILRVPEDLPAPVLDVALGEAHLWVATTVGIARVALEVFAQ